MHQGDRDGAKGVYLVNIVDEVTQYEYVGAAENISERFLTPLLEAFARPVPVRRRLPLCHVRPEGLRKQAILRRGTDERSSSAMAIDDVLRAALAAQRKQAAGGESGPSRRASGL